MAGRIQGIVIEVGGDTSKLQKSLNQLQAPINKINTELKNVNQALKLDPKNTELLAQKQEILGRNIQATKDKLEALKKAQQEMGEYSKLTEQQKEVYNRLSLEIAKSENALKSMNKELKETTRVDLSKITDGLKKVGEVALDVSKKMLEVSTAIGGALASVVGLGVKSYASLEQNLGAIDKLFEDSAETVKKNASEAYKTVGISANQYMETASKLSGFLIKDLAGNTEEASRLIDVALRNAGDNANTYSNTLEDTINVYTALAKEQYRTLDNLSLGYAGTKEGMKELIKDASDYAKAHKELNTEVDATSLSFDNIIKAIDVIQQKQGIANTTLHESTGTITGSVNAMKSAFDNFLNGTGSPEQLSETIINVLNNIAKAIKKVAPNILTGIVSLIKDLLPEVVRLLFELIPQLLDAITDLIDQLLDLLTNNTESVQKAVTELINKVVTFITDNLPKILQIALTLVITLAKGIAESIPTLIPAIVECIIQICDTIVENLPLLIEAVLLIITKLVEALNSEDGAEKLVEYIPTLIVKLVEVIIKCIPLILEAIVKIIESAINCIVRFSGKIIDKGKEFVDWLIQGIQNMLGKLGQKAGDIINTIKDTLASLPSKAVQWGKDMIQGLIDGIKGMIGNVGKAVKGVADKIASFLHFSKPDKGPLHEYQTWMPDFIKGLADGIEKSSYMLEDATLDLANDMTKGVFTSTSQALRSLKAGVNSSLNPTINPTYSYDLNYQLMAMAMKEALKEVNVELDDRQVGKFIDKTVSEEVYS